MVGKDSALRSGQQFPRAQSEFELSWIGSNKAENASRQLISQIYNRNSPSKSFFGLRNLHIAIGYLPFSFDRSCKLIVDFDVGKSICPANSSWRPVGFWPGIGCCGATSVTCKGPDMIAQRTLERSGFLQPSISYTTSESGKFSFNTESTGLWGSGARDSVIPHRSVASKMMQLAVNCSAYPATRSEPGFSL